MNRFLETKRRCTRAILLPCLIALCLATSVEPAERRLFNAVDNHELLTLAAECRKGVHQGYSRAFVCFLPEYVMAAVIQQEQKMTMAQAVELPALLKGKCVVAIARSQVDVIGQVYYLDQLTIARGIKIMVKKPGREPIPMHRLENIPTDLILHIESMLRPFIATAVGPWGDRLHFYLFDNADADGTDIYDPCKDEKVHISLAKMVGAPEATAIHDTICTSLFKPRFCKNGKPAHVTWKYDPWTGEKLPH